jgi:putative Mg2+ transporter-C (MgtC) family protein
MLQHWLGSELLAAIALRLVAALGAGALIGLERSYHGRPAGFRTHALVCMASSALMLVTAYQSHWFSAPEGALHASMDPTRMAQGIMTGIGFLGAGVIMKDGLSVRGLTTAASIWITAGIGILVGIGFFSAAGLTALLTIASLGGLRWIEQRMRTESYAHLSVRFTAEYAPAEAELLKLVQQFGFSPVRVSYWFREAAGLEYSVVMHSLEAGAVGRLSEALRSHAHILEFKLSPTGD